MKNISSYITKWGVFGIFTTVVISLSVASVIVINRFKKQEIQRVEVIATAMKIIQENPTDSHTLELILAIVKDNNSIPVILTDQYKKPILAEGTYRNIPEHIINNPQKIKAFIQEMEQSYQPFLIRMPNGNHQYIFYANSPFLDYLQYYPWGLAVFIGGYFCFSFWFFRTLKKNSENHLWAGLAKETAHQIGTPLSSMIGWIEVLKAEHQQSESVKEIERDIQRLTLISERFSKIGSVPEFNELNIKETLQQNYDYLKRRISRQIDFSLSIPSNDILLPHSQILLSWVIENLVKNAVDAMKGKGQLSLKLYEKNGKIIIDFQDSGCGMSKSQMRKIFKPGFSTKNRGWGLGLSLVKRVIEEYHSGEVKVVSSEVGKGSLFRVIL